jgi:hypothetical protein
MAYSKAKMKSNGYKTFPCFNIASLIGELIITDHQWNDIDREEPKYLIKYLYL